MTRPYDEFVRNAKSDADAATPEIDWAEVDDRLFQRIAAESSRGEFERRRRIAWGVGSLAVAAAATGIWIAVPANRGDAARNPTPLAALPASLGPSVGTVVSIDGAGDIKIDHQSAQNGSALHRGQRLEAERARVVFERVDPSGIAYTFESGTRALVKDALPTLVLALETGAVEAQVQHIKTGDAFAVDVGQARVAVHGTHLRVAREGEFVTVDLSEGVISLGTVDGTREVLIAPVHAEFNANRVRETLRVDREQSRVRVPVTLRRWAELVPSIAMGPKEPSTPLSKTPLALRNLQNGALGTNGQVSELLSPSQSDSQNPAAPPPDKEPEAPKAPVRLLDPAAEITSGVQRCIESDAVVFGKRDEENSNGASVTTSLQLRIGADGQVQAARFNPAISPAAMTCASAVIYRTKFATPGDRAIQIRYVR